jgi:Na+/proline symporter
LLVAFVALAMFPDLRQAKDPGVGFPMVMRELSPPGLRGVIMVAFFSAFMSTISTQMNWGASYLVRDFIQPLFARDASEKTLARYSKLASTVVLFAGSICAWIMKSRGISVDSAWKMLAALGAGSGAVYMLRWFWWRINAWTEISAMIASLGYYLLLTSAGAQSVLVGDGKLFSNALSDTEMMAFVALLTIITWVAVTMLTRPESDDVLSDFYRRIRPGGPGWKPIAARNPDVVSPDRVGLQILAAIVATALVYTVLPGIGYIIFGKWAKAGVCSLLTVVWIVWLSVLTKKLFPVVTESVDSCASRSGRR